MSAQRTTQTGEATGVSSPPSSLRRGHACITCRRKKMRCDGARPFCGQCALTRGPKDCEYTDKQGRTHIEALEERLRLLRSRVKELETQSENTSSVLLRDPYANFRGGNNTHTTTRRSEESSINALDYGVFTGIRPPSSFPKDASVSSELLAQMDDFDTLLQIFLPHSHRLGFALHIPTLLDAFKLPSTHQSRPHGFLLATISLWAARISQSPPLLECEPRFLTIALESVPAALMSTDARHRVQLVQAEILLALYFFNDGRLLEGRYHASSAMTTALGYGLHQLGTRALSPQDSASPRISAVSKLAVESLRLPRPQDALELGERIRVFWLTFAIDRCWSVALGYPPCLIDEQSSAMNIEYYHAAS
ncbi:hypothetical protein DFH11DRAFT_106074 [Phellopilus nigrolimitatus]|nr:hypothetical protein DFH11DRAFT_106074 [Phellopilus nigrolimitatus]